VAGRLKDGYGVRHFSTGNLLRNEIQRESEIGLKVKNIVGSGGLVDDALVNEIVEQNLQESLAGGSVVVLDGYPRTVPQAEALDLMMAGGLRERIVALEIDVAPEELVARLSARLVCVKCGDTYGAADKVEVCRCGGQLVKRKDDDSVTVARRLEKYEAETRPVADYYGARLRKVAGEGAPEEVMKRVEALLLDLKIEKRGDCQWPA
jgi:adenylate kinase